MCDVKLSTGTEHPTNVACVISSVLPGKAMTLHRSTLLDFLESSMNSGNVLHAIQKGLMSRRLMHVNAFSTSADGCSVNFRAHTAIERDRGWNGF
jgi:hypothetical protein